CRALAGLNWHDVCCPMCGRDIIGHGTSHQRRCTVENREMDTWRSEFQNLDWNRGWTRQDLMNRFPNVPHHYWDRCPADKKFFNFNEFWQSFQPSSATGGHMG